MLYIIFAYLMSFAALSNAVCMMLLLPMIFLNAFCFHALSWFDTLLTHFLVISSTILHHAQCF